jgi:hypothetical protein
MKGSNELRVCQSQLLDIIQYYFDNVLFSPLHSPLAMSVDTDSNYNFVIKVEERGSDTEIR